MALENLTEELLYSCKGGIAKLTLNRPDKLNAITQDMFDGMEQVVGEVRNNDDVKVLVITGAGRGFCSGADVVARLAARVAGEGPKKTRKAMVAPVGYIASILHRLDKPIIGAIKTIALGGPQLNFTHSVEFNQPVFKAFGYFCLTRFYFSGFFIVGNHCLGTSSSR